MRITSNKFWQISHRVFLMEGSKIEDPSHLGCQARFRGPNLWNQLPETLRSSHNQETFKRDIKMAKAAIKTSSFQKEASLITFKQQDFIYY